MRYKFRGLTKNDEWKFGDLINGKFATYIRDFYSIDLVIPETIGLFSTYVDENDTEVFEGDILKHFPTGHLREIKEIKGALWSCQIDGKQKFPLHFLQSNKIENCMIIGTIYTHKELMK